MIHLEDRNVTTKRRSLPFIVFALAACLMLGMPSAVRATAWSCYVYSTPDLYTCFNMADSHPENYYTVYIATARTYDLTKPLILTKGTVFLQSVPNTLASAGSYILDGGYKSRAGGWTQIFRVVGTRNGMQPYLSISGITIQHGLADQAAGGGIYVRNADFSITDSYIQNNASTSLGSGLYVDSGEAYVTNCVVRNNFNLYAAPPDPSQILCGGVQGSGAGLTTNDYGQLYVYRSSITGNTACRGGGIAGYPNSHLTVENSLIDGNAANLNGGGIVLLGNMSVNLRFNTITNNSAGNHPTGGSSLYDEMYGGGIALMQWSGSIATYGNVVAQNSMTKSSKATLGYDGKDCFDRYDSRTVSNRNGFLGPNFFGAVANCPMWGSSGTESSPLDPKLGSRTWETGTRGQQQTRPPLAGSPVIGSYSASYGPYCTYNDELGHLTDWYQPYATTVTHCDYGARQYHWFH
jgi:hypothetical protein